MDVFVFVLCIVAITTLGGLIREKLKNDRKQVGNQNEEQINTRFAEMEARIQTLERIVTDQKTLLKDKIDAL